MQILKQQLKIRMCTCRFKTFTEESMPVVDKYSAQGKAHKISAVPPPDQVFLEVEKVLQPVFGQSAAVAEPATTSTSAVVQPVASEPAAVASQAPEPVGVLPATAADAQPVVLYSKRPSANWVGSDNMHCASAYMQARL